MALFSRGRNPNIQPYTIEIRGAKTSFAGDWYHLMLRAPWWFDVLAISACFLLVNVLFALAYLATGGIVGVHADSFGDLFFFSVQTMSTVGYGSMYPSTTLAHVLTTAESITGVFVVALVTGIVFSKFSVIRARVKFASSAVIAPMDGIPTLMFRLGNERASRVIDARIRVVLTRTEKTREGVVMYRMYDLGLEREWAPALSRSWTVMHRVTEASPLHGQTPELLKSNDVELTLTLAGIDETSGQLLHAARTYVDAEIRWGARHADMLSELPNGMILDVTKFDELAPTGATDAFPYSMAPSTDRLAGPS
jgi:inward rectifier potassium channel